VKRLALLCALLVWCWAASCGGGKTVQGPGPDGRLEVRVHWHDQGVADKRLEVLGLGMEQRTDADGRAAFSVPAGSHTLRAYEINGPGPILPFQDLPFTSAPGDTTRIDIVDCLPCAGAR